MAIPEWRSRTIGRKQERHGKRKLPEYQVWLQMKGRCHNPRNKRYHYYGGRGIAVCKKWRDSFTAFLADMGPRPEGGRLERENNNKGYTPTNCVWATQHQQARNKRNNRWYTYKGRTLILSDGARETGIRKGLLRTRLVVLGWDVAKALETPVGAPRKNSRFVTARGRTQTIAQWARELGMNRCVIRARLERGCSAEEALVPTRPR